MDLFRHLAHEDGVQEEGHTDSRITCNWHKEEFYGTANAKKSISAGMFILFLGYTLFVLLKQSKKETAVSFILLFEFCIGRRKNAQNHQ